MKQLNNYIVEKLNKISSKNTGQTYNYFPKDKKELEKIIEDLIKERGNKADLNDIDTSEITDMRELFIYSNFNGDISKWNVSNATTTNDIFYNSPLQNNPPKWYKK